MMAPGRFRGQRHQDRSGTEASGRNQRSSRVVPAPAAAVKGAVCLESLVKKVTVKRTFVHFDGDWRDYDDPEWSETGLGNRRRSSSLPPANVSAADPDAAGKAASAKPGGADARHAAVEGACAPSRGQVCDGRGTVGLGDVPAAVGRPRNLGPVAATAQRGSASGGYDAAAAVGMATAAACGTAAPPGSVLGVAAHAAAAATTPSMMSGGPGSVSADPSGRGTGILDGRRISSKDTRVCCTIHVSNSEYVVTLSPMPGNDRRGGSSFTASRGIGLISVKANSPADAALKVAITIGSDQSPCTSTFRAHRHNFHTDGVWRIQPQNGIDFSRTLDAADGKGIPALHIALSVQSEAAALAARQTPATTYAPMQPVMWAAYPAPMMWPTYMGPGYPPLNGPRVVDVLDDWSGGDFVSEDDFSAQQVSLEAAVLSEGTAASTSRQR